MAFKMPSDEELEAARERSRIADNSEPRAKAAWYDEASGRVFLELTNECLFAFPARFGQGLQGATPKQLAAVEVWPDGAALHWEELDADLGVAGLVAGVFGSKAWMSELGRAGGRVQSEAKARASRENGKKGGRPRKSTAAPSTILPTVRKRKVA